MSLPSEKDFRPHTDCLDQEHAWRTFGRLTIDEAYLKFQSRPEIYQEDFMFMGTAAFCFYFPVIERYILNARLDAEEDEIEAMCILASGIENQLDNLDQNPVLQLLDRISELSTHVRNHLPQYDTSPIGQKLIDRAWANLEKTVENLHRKT